MNSEEGIGKKFRRLCLRNPPASAVPRHPPFDKGGFVLSTYCTAVTIPGAKRLPCQRELSKIFDF